MTIAHETGRVRSGEVSIHYRKLGRPGATPILIVHGLSYFSYDWLEVAQALAGGRGYREVVPRWQGTSSTCSTPRLDAGRARRPFDGRARAGRPTAPKTRPRAQST